MLKGKTVLLGVTGGIAAYKIPNLCSLLVKQGACVETILTANAQKIVSPIPFESLSGNRCHITAGCCWTCLRNREPSGRRMTSCWICW